ncbi:hypothetical protein DPEC_G00006980 [Dallia pectoralis]|uniref:Uncharacterized protein n=1 Tax=Dallia pectoralis TaxID=75939 RepID=A0ACC2HL56_DALPE|nr:hypothetical protein DPEC_G00006980 [Dallia pectoralis]
MPWVQVFSTDGWVLLLQPQILSATALPSHQDMGAWRPSLKVTVLTPSSSPPGSGRSGYIRGFCSKLDAESEKFTGSPGQ